MDKRAFYQREDVVDNYDDWRFGSPGGRYVDQLEQRTLLTLLADAPRDGALLDLPCGTGRLLRTLAREGFSRLTGGDTSPAMLAKSRAAVPTATLLEADAFATPFADASFDTVCSLRFLFHVEDPAAFFREMRRILKPGGQLVFDSLRWTPRGLVPAIDRKLGGRLHCLGQGDATRLLAKHGFTVTGGTRVFALPSLAYRFLPGFLVPAVAWLERWLPRTGFSKVFLVARRDPE